MSARSFHKLGFLFAAVLVASVTHARDVKQYTIEQFLDTVAINGASFSPDGSKILVSSDQTGIFNAFAIPVDGSAAVQLTHSTTDSIFAYSYFPSDERFIYGADQGGNELTHIYVRELDGSAKDITPGEKVKAAFHSWADDKRSFFITSNERNPSFFDLYEVKLDDYARERIYTNDGGFDIGDVSPDKRYIALTKPHTNAKTDVFIFDREKGEARQITQHDHDVVCTPQRFTKDNSALYCLTDHGHEFAYLVLENLQSGEKTTLDQPDWDIAYAALSETDKYLVVNVNNDARSELKLYEAATMKPVALPKTEGAGIESVRFNADDTAIAFYVHGGRTPGDLYYWKLDGSATPKQLTRRLNKEIDPNDLVEPEVVRYKSYDGLEIPGILYKPHQASVDNKLPALVYVHGGPGGQTRATYSPQIQYLVNHGYVVYGINNRGSSGYGKSFYAMDDLKHGSADLDDCVASKQMLIDTGYVDPDRIGIMGGSYGGYMVCAALAFRPDAFKVGVDIFGVTNWVRTLKSIPAWWEATRNALYKELGDPATQEDYLHKISPLFHAKNITKPMIVLQGRNDPRVLQVESDEMVAAIRANGVPVEYMVFDDEGHGFRKKENQIEGNQAILDFLNKYL